MVITKFGKETLKDYGSGFPYLFYGIRPAICFLPGNRPDPLEESAASQTWREMTEHMREQA